MHTTPTPHGCVFAGMHSTNCMPTSCSTASRLLKRWWSRSSHETCTHRQDRQLPPVRGIHALSLPEFLDQKSAALELRYRLPTGIQLRTLCDDNRVHRDRLC